MYGHQKKRQFDATRLHSAVLRQLLTTRSRLRLSALLDPLSSRIRIHDRSCGATELPIFNNISPMCSRKFRGASHRPTHQRSSACSTCSGSSWNRPLTIPFPAHTCTCSYSSPRGTLSRRRVESAATRGRCTAQFNSARSDQSRATELYLPRSFAEPAPGPLPSVWSSLHSRPCTYGRRASEC
jgi:hypothetical protein